MSVSEEYNRRVALSLRTTPYFLNWFPKNLIEFNAATSKFGAQDKWIARYLWDELIRYSVVKVVKVMSGSFVPGDVIYNWAATTEVETKIALFNLFGLRQIGVFPLSGYEVGQAWRLRITMMPGQASENDDGTSNTQTLAAVGYIVESAERILGDIKTWVYLYTNRYIEAGYTYATLSLDFISSFPPAFVEDVDGGDILITLDPLTVGLSPILGLDFQRISAAISYPPIFGDEPNIESEIDQIPGEAIDLIGDAAAAVQPVLWPLAIIALTVIGIMIYAKTK